MQGDLVSFGPCAPHSLTENGDRCTCPSPMRQMVDTPRGLYDTRKCRWCGKWMPLVSPERLGAGEKMILDQVGWGGWLDLEDPSNETVKVSAAFGWLVNRGFFTNPSGDGRLYRLTPKGRRYVGL